MLYFCSPSLGFTLRRQQLYFYMKTSSSEALTVSFKSKLNYRPLRASGSRAFSLSSSAILRRRARRSAADEESWGRRGARRSRREGSPKLLKSSGYSESQVLNTVHTALQGWGERCWRKKLFYISRALVDVTLKFIGQKSDNILFFSLDLQTVYKKFPYSTVSVNLGHRERNIFKINPRVRLERKKGGASVSGSNPEVVQVSRSRQISRCKLELIEYIDIFNTSKKLPGNHVLKGCRQEKQLRDESVI